jgi:2-polyprenyl-3-methyl-5-hydroxy-6-metoxy-1,4-benzoquinol methylase
MFSLYSRVYARLKSLKDSTQDETNGRHLIAPEIVKAIGNRPSPRLLDVGAGRGADLAEIARQISDKRPELFAIESNSVSIGILRQHGIKVTDIDIEHQRIPFADGFFDAVLCNQVLEHVKEIFWIVSELTRVLNRDGILLLGVPNLGSWHNRIALLFGQQPPAINVFGAHVRGFTVPALTDFLQLGGLLKVTKVIGGNFYPFPSRLSRPLCRMLPRLAVSSFYIVKRTNTGYFLDILDRPEAAVLVDTPYFRGPGMH